MNHRHLLPHEFDLLIDGEVGFGLTPLRTHARECGDCAAQLEQARALTDMLDALPAFAPSPQFANRVMARVQVFVPWHVAALDTVRGWIPRSRPARILAVAMAGSIATVVSVATLWMLARLDLVVFFSGIAVGQVRTTLEQGLGSALGRAFGPAGAQLVGTNGPAALAMLALTLVVMAAIAAFGLRAIATASARRRS